MSDPAGAAMTGTARASGTVMVAQRVVHGTVVALRRARARWLVASLQARAWWRRARVEVALADDVRFGRRVRLSAAPGSRSVVHIGPGCLIGDDVCIELGGGRLLLGPGVDLRARSTLFVNGTLCFEGHNLLQRGCSFHCDESITVGHQASLGDYSTVVDSSHTFDGPHQWFLHDLVTAPVVIEADVWLGVKATVTKGVRIGRRAVIGANSVVVKDVPAGYLASGVPARNLRPFARDTGTGTGDDPRSRLSSSSS